MEDNKDAAGRREPLLTLQKEQEKFNTRNQATFAAKEWSKIEAKSLKNGRKEGEEYGGALCPELEYVGRVDE